MCEVRLSIGSSSLCKRSSIDCYCCSMFKPHVHRITFSFIPVLFTTLLRFVIPPNLLTVKLSYYRLPFLVVPSPLAKCDKTITGREIPARRIENSVTN